MNIKEIKSDINKGKELFESIPKQYRPGLGVSLLLRFEDYIENVPIQIQELYDIVEDNSRWKDAYQQFSKIRSFLLANKKYKPESYLLLAENVAKVTYNLSGYPAQFDKDTGWYIPSCAICTAEYFKDDTLVREIYEVLLLYYNKR